MRKSDKKIDNQIRLALTDVCELALENVPGFSWLTHTVNYARFPESLMVICVFANETKLSQAQTESLDNYLSNLIQEKLLALDIKLKNIRQHVRFSTE